MAVDRPSAMAGVKVIKTDRLPLPTGFPDPLDDIPYHHGPCVDCGTDAYFRIGGTGGEKLEPGEEFVCEDCIGEYQYYDYDGDECEADAA